MDQLASLLRLIGPRAARVRLNMCAHTHVSPPLSLSLVAVDCTGLSCSCLDRLHLFLIVSESVCFRAVSCLVCPCAFLSIFPHVSSVSRTYILFSLSISLTLILDHSNRPTQIPMPGPSLVSGGVTFSTKKNSRSSKWRNWPKVSPRLFPSK